MKIWESSKKNDLKIEEEKEQAENFKNALEARDADKVRILTENYDKDLFKMLENYKQIGSIDFTIFEQLGLKRENILQKIKEDISELKNKYWRLTFDILDELNTKLTYKSRNRLLKDIDMFKNLDFNSNNIRTVCIWVIENHNQFIKSQIVKIFEDLTETDYLHAYKSNTRFREDNWRYLNCPEKYALDYRIVTRLNMSQYGYERFRDNIITDLIVVANNLGFYTSKTLEESDVTHKEAHYIYDNQENILFEYRIHGNGNVHFKINQDFLKTLNIEAGKLKGWLKAPQDIMEEFNLSLDECVDFFVNPKLRLLDQNGVKLLVA